MHKKIAAVLLALGLILLFVWPDPLLIISSGKTIVGFGILNVFGILLLVLGYAIYSKKIKIMGV